MSESRNANHFYKAWKGLVARATEAHRDLMVAKDIAHSVSKPKVPDFPSKRDIIRAEAHLESYNAIQHRVRFYRQRWVRLDEAASVAFRVWIALESKSDDLPD